MSATLAKPASHQITIAEARAVFTRARDTRWPEHVRRALGDAGMDLAVELKAYDDLIHGIVPPWCPGIKAGPEGKAAVLRIAADRAWEAAEIVAAVIAEHYGDAANASGSKGEAA